MADSLPSTKFQRGETIFLPGAGAEPTALVSDVLGASDVEVTTTFLPGVNRLNAAAIGPGSRVTGVFMQPSLGDAQRAGSFRHLPMSYSAALKWLREAAPFDTCVVQVSPPDADGRCSLGPSAEFTPEVLRRARRIVAVVNPRVPRLVNAPSIAFSDIGLVVQANTPLVMYDAGDADPDAVAIAAHISSLIEDGSALQVGLGKVPQALMHRLHDRRSLRLHSGMLSDGIISLAERGCLDPEWLHVTTAVLGTQSLYDWVVERQDIAVRGVEYTHDPSVLAGIKKLVAVNAALEVDVFGQCNLEFAGGRAVSGAGGAPDFARATRFSPGGISVIALPSTFGGSTGSRIVVRLGAPAVASLSRTDVDVIVTEQGIADLRGRSVHERAEAIIGISDPKFRAELTAQWREIADRL